MNDKRRKELNVIYSELHLRIGQLDDLLNQEQDAYDNLPEGLQNSEKGEQIQECIDAVEQAKSELQTVLDTLGQLEFIQEI